MQKAWKRIELGLVAVGLCLALLLTAAIPVCEAGPDEEEVVKLGLFAVFTGPIATTVIPANYAMLDCVRYLNEHGGINGIKVDMLWEDTKAWVPESIRAYKRFKYAGVVGVHCYSSTPIETLLPQFQRDEIPNLSLIPLTRGMLSKPPWVFGTTPGFGPEAVTMMKWMKDNWTEERPLKFGVLMYDHSSAWDALEGIKEYAPKLGIEFVGYEILGAPPVPPIDVSVQWLRLAGKNPDWVYVYSCGSFLVVPMKDAGRLEIQKRGIKLCCNYIGGDEYLLKVVGERDSEGWFILSPVRYPTEREEFGGVAPALYESAKKWRGYEPEEVCSHYLLGWIGTSVLIEGVRLAIEKVGFENLNGRAVRDGLASIKDFETGVFPRVSISDEKPFWTPRVRLCQVRKLEIWPYTDWLEPVYTYT